jgi:hypothetical protein
MKIKARPPPAGLPVPTPRFRRDSWAAIQKALDPLGPPRPLREAAPPAREDS